MNIRTMGQHSSREGLVDQPPTLVPSFNFFPTATTRRTLTYELENVDDPKENNCFLNSLFLSCVPKWMVGSLMLTMFQLHQLISNTHLSLNKQDNHMKLEYSYFPHFPNKELLYNGVNEFAIHVRVYKWCGRSVPSSGQRLCVSGAHTTPSIVVCTQ